MTKACPGPTILFFPFDLLSHYVRCLQLATAIRNRYTVYFAHSQRYTPLVEGADFATFPCAALNAETAMAGARRFDFSWLEEIALEKVYRSQAEQISALGPVAVLGDAVPTLKMAAEATGTPYIGLLNGYMSKHYQYVRRIARVHPAARFEDKLPRALFERMVKLGERIAFGQVHRPFKRLRQRYGLTRQRSYLDELEGDYNLLCDLPCLYPQAKLPLNYRWLGPLFHASTDPEPEVRRFLGEDRPRLLVSMGSSGDFGRVAFLNGSSFSQYRIVAAGTSQGRLSSDHILEKPFINTCAVMDRIDLVICHGGNGSIYQALAFGVPVLCVPSIFEHEWNLQGLERLGLGTALVEEGDTKGRIAQFEYWMAQKGAPALQQIRQEIDLKASRQNFRAFLEEVVPI